MALLTRPAAAPERRPTTPAGRRSRSSSWWGAAFALPHGAGLAFFTVVPIAASLVISFFNWPLLGTPSWVGFGNFAKILSDPVFGQVVVNTVLFVVLYVPLNLIISLGLAAWLTRRIRGRHIFRVIFFIPAITPVVANAVV